RAVVRTRIATMHDSTTRPPVPSYATRQINSQRPARRRLTSPLRARAIRGRSKSVSRRSPPAVWYATMRACDNRAASAIAWSFRSTLVIAIAFTSSDDEPSDGRLIAQRIGGADVDARDRESRPQALQDPHLAGSCR